MSIIANRYELGDLLGVGGMGEVYKAHDRLTGETIALKRVLAGSNPFSFNAEADNQKLTVALAREFKALASLRHPHIINVLDYGFDDQRIPFFTMEYIPEAKSILHAGYQQSINNLIGLLLQLLQGLDYLHRRGMLHRDLKPNNIIVHNHQVKIIDFGLAIDFEHAQGGGGTIIYMSPEQFAGHSPSIASDLYMVGLVAYQLFVRQYPFNLDNHVDDIVRDILEKPVDISAIPSHIAPVVQRLLEKKPSARYANASDTIQAFCEAIGQDLPTETVAIRESYLYASIFVGRQEELKIINNALDRVIEGDTAFYLIGGESGVGKSRLVDELRIQALVKGGQVWRGQGVDSGGLTFQAWRAIVRRLLLTVEATDEQCSILKDIVPDIEFLLQKPVYDAPPLTGADYQRRLVNTMIDLLKQVKLPLCLILEDLQWMNESLLPLQHLLTVKKDFNQLMIVGTYRNDERPDLPASLPNMLVLNLPRLDSHEISELSTAMLGFVGQKREIVDFLMQETEGNTFFMVEIVRTLAEEAGSISEIIHKTLPQSVFTGGIEHLLQRRLAKIPTIYQDILQVSAVAGRQIDKHILYHFYANRQHVEDFLHQAELAAVLSVQDNHWQFSHDKLREAVLNDISPQLLFNLHRQVAFAIEAVYPEDGGYHDMLYYHWRNAHDLDKEAYYLQFVAPRLIGVGEYEKTRHFIDTTLSNLPENDQRRIPLLRPLAESYELQGIYEQAEQIANQFYQLANTQKNPKWLASSLQFLGFINYRHRRYQIAKGYSEQALTIYEDLGDLQGKTSCLNTLASIAYESQDYATAETYHQQNLKYRQMLQDEWGYIATLTNLGIVATVQEHYGQAQSYFQEGLKLAERSADTWKHGNILGEYGFLKLKLGQDAISEFVEAIKILQYIKAYPVLLESLVGYAITLVRHNKAYQAAQLAGLISNHPDNIVYVQDRLRMLSSELSAVLKQSEITKAQTEGSRFDFNEVIKGIIHEVD